MMNDSTYPHEQTELTYITSGVGTLPQNEREVYMP